jgi:serine/threonine protein kinase
VEGTLFAGRYRVGRPLGAGGMGSVFAVVDETVCRPRALKLLSPALAANPEARARFEREARVGATIASDHVVEVVAAGVEPDAGQPYLVMELAEGEDLGARLASRGPLPPREVATLLRQLAHGLGAAHAAGVIHRDLKPENLFLARTREARGGETLKILDFGVAKLLTAEAHTTQAVGTPLWMAPEQTQAGAQVGPHTDLWSAALVAFALLTGRSYWLAANRGTAEPMALLREIVLDPLPVASQRARELGFDGALPPGFDRWLARVLVREPALRPSDARAELEALADSLEGASTGRSALADARAPTELAPRAHPSQPPLLSHRAASDEPPAPSPRADWVGLGVLGALAVLAASFAATGRATVSPTPALPTPTAAASLEAAPSSPSRSVESSAPAESADPAPLAAPAQSGSARIASAHHRAHVASASGGSLASAVAPAPPRGPSPVAPASTMVTTGALPAECDAYARAYRACAAKWPAASQGTHARILADYLASIRALDASPTMARTCGQSLAQLPSLPVCANAPK